MTVFNCTDKSAITVISGELPESMRPDPDRKMVPVIYNCKEQCGKCCGHFYIGLRREDAADPDFRQALAMRGIKIVPLFGGVAIIEKTCKHLYRLDDGRATCLIYAERPHYCSAYNCLEDPIMSMIKAMEK